MHPNPGTCSYFLPMYTAAAETGADDDLLVLTQVYYRAEQSGMMRSADKEQVMGKMSNFCP